MSSAPAKYSLLVLYIWTGLQIAASQVLLPLLVFTFCFMKTRRHVTLVNLCIAWIISGVVSLLLFYTGKDRGPEPSFKLCLVQASLLSGVPPMTALAVVALVFQTWSSVYSTAHRGKEVILAKLPCVVWVILPYIAFLAFSAAAAVLGVEDPSRISRDRRFFYCSIQHEIFTDTMSAFTAAVLLVAAAMKVWLGRFLFQTWRSTRNTKRCGVDVHLVLRVAIFDCWVMLALLFSVLSIWNRFDLVADMFAASIGIAITIIFGSQADVLKAWCFWRKYETTTLSTSHSDLGSPTSTTTHKSLPPYPRRSWRFWAQPARPSIDKNSIQKPRLLETV